MHRSAPPLESHMSRSLLGFLALHCAIGHMRKNSAGRGRPEIRCATAVYGSFRDFLGPYKSARSSRKFAYGVCGSEKRALTAVLGPKNPTFIIPHFAAFVNRQNAQKIIPQGS